MAETTRDTVMTETLRLHDLRYGNAHCERKWVHICPKFQELIFEAGDNLRRAATHPAEQPERDA